MEQEKKPAKPPAKPPPRPPLKPFKIKRSRPAKRVTRLRVR
jgi:hypothetical protein